MGSWCKAKEKLEQEKELRVLFDNAVDEGYCSTIESSLFYNFYLASHGKNLGTEKLFAY